MSGFYLKLTEAEANVMIAQGLSQLFGGTPTKFKEYTYRIEDLSTGDKYWLVQDYWGYPCEQYVIDTFPDLPRYTPEFVSQFISEHHS